MEAVFVFLDWLSTTEITINISICTERREPDTRGKGSESNKRTGGGTGLRTPHYSKTSQKFFFVLLRQVVTMMLRYCLHKIFLPSAILSKRQKLMDVCFQDDTLNSW